MKKIILSLTFIFTVHALFAQQGNENKDKKEKTGKEFKMDDKDRKDNMGQTIKEVNAYYRDRRKEIKNDPSMSKVERKERIGQLKDQKNARIHEINSGNAYGYTNEGKQDGIMGKAENDKMKEKEVKEKEKEAKKVKGKNNKGNR